MPREDAACGVVTEQISVVFDILVRTVSPSSFPHKVQFIQFYFKKFSGWVCCTLVNGNRVSMSECTDTRAVFFNT